MRTLPLPLLLLASALQAQIALGPERLVCNPRFQAPAASGAAAATNGAETLVVLQTGASRSLYLQRLGAQGEPLTEHGVPIARGVRDLGGIASAGTGYVVLWTTDHALWSLSIDGSGNISPPHFLAASDSLLLWPHLATNGVDYLAAWGDTTGNDQQAMAVRLDGSGWAVGAPFALSERRNVAQISALASDGHDYVVAVERLAGLEAKTTLVSVDGGTKADLPLFLYALVHTASGFIGFSEANVATAVAVDASGHLGAPATLSGSAFSSAASNGNDAIALVFDGTAIRVRRNGDAIETIDTTPIPGLAARSVAATTHTGSYAAISLGLSADVALVNGAAAERPLLTFPAAQAFPAIAGDGDLRVAAWREGTSVRAARIRGGVTLDAAGLDVNSGPQQVIGSPALAMNAGRTLIAWPEQPQTNSSSPMWPQHVVGRLLKPDGTLTAPFTIADSIQFISLGSVTATASGFAVLWRMGVMDDFFGIGGWRVTTVDANGNVGATTQPAGSQAPGAAIVRSADGFLTILRNELPDAATDGEHFLEVWSKESVTHEHQIWAQPLDGNGTRVGTARLLGGGDGAHVTWNGSLFVVVSGPSVALVTVDGSVLAPLTPLLAADSAQSVIAGDTIATRHSAIDTGAGDANVVLVRSFSLTPPRRRAARP